MIHYSHREVDDQERRKKMKLKELRKVMDCMTPVWIDADDDCERYDREHHIPDYYNDMIVEYVTVDGEGEMTIVVGNE